VLDRAHATQRVTAFDAAGPWPAAALCEATLPSGVPALLVDCPPLFLRAGGPYQDAAGRDYPDNAQRFAFLARVAAWLSGPKSPFYWRPDVVQCNDWQEPCARLPAFRRRSSSGVGHDDPQPRVPGNISRKSVCGTDLPAQAFAIDGIEFYGQTSFLAGIPMPTRFRR
jgi:starch synthase